MTTVNLTSTNFVLLYAFGKPVANSKRLIFLLIVLEDNNNSNDKNNSTKQIAKSLFKKIRYYLL